MEDFKKGVRFSALAVREEFRNANFYLFLIIVFFVLQFCFSGVGDYLASQKDKMNIFELYIPFMSCRTSQIIYLIGILLFSCGVNFFNTGTAYYLIRADKNVWVIGRLLYLMETLVFYNAFLLLNLWWACGGRLSVRARWSEAYLAASQYGSESIGIWPIVQFSYGLTGNNPNVLGFFSLLLAILIGLIVGALVINFHQRNRLVYGVLAIIGIWYLDILVENTPNLKNILYISPFGLSRLYRLSLNGGGPVTWYAISYLACLFLAILYISRNQSEKIDFIKIE